ncbi:hypothetical protein TIFTF001_001989 [Ficus carica]|uniref:Uncharacterized protein n=1 Tax=Ficus carica TaxID=3494 RepID=A0AA87ZRB2_FICCA|nr:hypothetical protein TIFTF001_001989 [Ficus carica]
MSTLGGKQPCRAAKVIFPGGEVRRFDEPVKAAELMLESPNFFVVNSRSLQMGRRFSALNADEDLEMANVYVMFPMQRVNSLVTAADMGALFLVAKKAVSGRKKRISPADQPTVAAPENLRKDDDHVAAAAPRLNLDDIENFSAPEFMHRLSMSRSKKPLLETIEE